MTIGWGYLTTKGACQRLTAAFEWLHCALRGPGDYREWRLCTRRAMELVRYEAVNLSDTAYPTRDKLPRVKIDLCAACEAPSVSVEVTRRKDGGSVTLKVPMDWLTKVWATGKALWHGIIVLDEHAEGRVLTVARPWSHSRSHHMVVADVRTDLPWPGSPRETSALIMYRARRKNA